MSGIVLDTNTVLALWLFADPTLARLLAAIQARRCTLFARQDALEELRCVLAYRQFELPPTHQLELLESYTRRCALIPAPDADAVKLPLCRDRDDQKFLEIARDAGASYLLTRDKALLKLNRHRLVRPLFIIATPDAFAPSD